MPGSGRRLPRTALRSNIQVVHLIPNDAIMHSRYSPLPNSFQGLEQPTPPKHFPFPNTPVDDDLFFEVLMFCFTITGAALQFLHLYRSVWWLPHSYTNQAMNFYLIDSMLVGFIVIILSRRVLYIIGCRLIDKYSPEKYQKTVHVSFTYFLFGIMFGPLIYCAYTIIQVHPIVNIFYLCYPVAVYLILFGLNIIPFFELVNWCTETQIPPLHACSSNPTEIRKEVENLKTSFNMRMKQILFNSILNAYYAGFIPCSFAQSFLYYDVYWAAQHVIFIFLGCFTSYAIHILPLRYCDTLHRSALHLGAWECVVIRPLLPVAYTWQEDMLLPFGSLVRHGKETYRAQGETNAAEPGNTTYNRFYNIFRNPSLALSGILALQIFLVLFQLALLVRCTYWYHIVSLTLLLFFNYYTLFKIGRDYLISLKIYRTEQIMHEKIVLH